MRDIWNQFLTAFALTAGVAAAAPAHAVTISYVSSSGNDSNTCGAPTQGQGATGPCATFTRAHAAADEGTLVVCVNAGYFGGFYITKSITIDCSSGGGGNNASYVIVNASGKNVRLRNIALRAIGGVDGIVQINAAGSVQIDNVSIIGSEGGGIIDKRTGPGKLAIKDALIAGHSGPAIVIAPQGGTTISAVLENVTAQDTTYGLAVGAGGRAIVSRSTFSGNFYAGVEGDPGSMIAIKDTRIAGNSVGILSSSGATIFVTNSDINSNNTAISGTVRSTGNNNVLLNISDGTPLSPVGATSGENGLR